MGSDYNVTTLMFDDLDKVGECVLIKEGKFVSIERRNKRHGYPCQSVFVTSVS